MSGYMGKEVQSWLPIGLVNCGKYGAVRGMNRIANVVCNKGIITEGMGLRGGEM